MKVAYPQACRGAERHAIETFGLQEDVLMERASLGAWSIFKGLFPADKRFAVVCGPGSNGGDGLALARHAMLDGLCPVVVLVGKEATPDSPCGRQLLILRKMGIDPVQWSVFRESDDFRQTEGLPGVDALFGTGLKRALQGDGLEAVDWLSQRPTLAMDLPSGLDGSTGRPFGGCVRALATATFGIAKPGLLLHPGRDFAGDVQVVDIGIPQVSWDHAAGQISVLDGTWAKNRLAPRSRGAHKSAVGRGFLLCGSDAYFGAAVLATAAALRSGLGLVHLGSTESVVSRIAQMVPESMGTVAVGEAVDLQELSKQVELADAVLVGPGLGQTTDARTALARVFERATSPMVIDADALNLCASQTDLCGNLIRLSKRHGAILTPHPGEAARLLDCSVDVLLADPIETAKRIAKRYGSVVVFKIATPVVASPDGPVAIGIAGHSGMAVGGCGDALAGAMLARLAEGVAPFEAACQTVRAHARAGDIAGAKGHRGMSVTDLIAALPAAWEEMETKSSH